MFVRILPLVFLPILLVFPSHARVLMIGQNRDFTNLSEASGTVTAGDTLLLMDDVYQAGTQYLEAWQGTTAAPIVIKPAAENRPIFRGGTEALHLVKCAYLIIEGLIVEQQTGNGINIDDGGEYLTPTHHITIRNCIFRDMAADGNNDLLKLSGLDDFLVEQCSFLRGGEGGSGIDMVGCHHGTIQDNYFDQAGVSGIQAKGGTQYILIRRNVLKDMGQRALNLGGSTGLQFFRPPLGNPIQSAFEAADLDVFSNLFIGSWSPVAYVGSVRVRVVNNTFYHPANWVFRILQETTEPGFVACADHVFQNNLIVQEHDLTEVNIGSNTDPESFTITHNLWFNASDNQWQPQLPVADPFQIVADPLLINAAQENFELAPGSPAIGHGLAEGAPVTDFFGQPFLNPPSIGAIEGGDATTTRQAIEASTGMILRPTICRDQISIELQAAEGHLQIVSLQGLPMEQWTVNSTSTTLSINPYPPGIYFVQWIVASQVKGTGKFIKL